MSFSEDPEFPMSPQEHKEYCKYLKKNKMYPFVDHSGPPPTAPLRAEDFIFPRAFYEKTGMPKNEVDLIEKSFKENIKNSFKKRKKKKFVLLKEEEYALGKKIGKNCNDSK